MIFIIIVIIISIWKSTIEGGGSGAAAASGVDIYNSTNRLINVKKIVNKQVLSFGQLKCEMILLSVVVEVFTEVF